MITFPGVIYIEPRIGLGQVNVSTEHVGMREKKCSLVINMLSGIYGWQAKLLVNTPTPTCLSSSWDWSAVLASFMEFG